MALLRPVERNCGPGSPGRVSRLVEAWRVRTLLCPGGRDPAPLAASLRLRSTLRPADAQPGPPRCARAQAPRRRAPRSPQSTRPRGAAGTTRQTRVQLSRHLLPELHLGSCPQRRDRQRPSS
ncbi:unnamed protein product [Rangifer tarandus platyrhynchus]|uniref:Uncharacterized protein n=1 Tax=Rangifer tarandus platyrhynchus TaxID=3082113 RepID=A0AC59YKZ6_RANTA